MNKPSKKAKITIAILTPVAAVLTAFIILCAVTMCMYPPQFLGRVLSHWDSSVSDYKIFPERVIERGGNPYVYEKDEYLSARQKTELEDFIKRTDTTSFLIVKDNKLICEVYANGYDENSVNTSFSMAKSVVSLMVAKAVEDGYIKNINQPISDYITEFADTDIGKTTVKQLLSMRSEIVYDEDKLLWFGDDTLTYWHPDLRKLALSHTKLTDEYNGKFYYNNYHPLLLGIILERATGVSVSKYFEREIWQKIGAEYDASWSLDGEKSFEKMESGINFRARDFIKLGSMVLGGGYFNGSRIISADLLKEYTLCEFPLNDGDYENTFLEGKNIGYKYMWYSTPSVNGGYDVFAWGKSDQIMYISPSSDAVILRTGKSDGGISNWAEVLKYIANRLHIARG